MGFGTRSWGGREVELGGVGRVRAQRFFITGCRGGNTEEVLHYEKGIEEMRNEMCIDHYMSHVILTSPEYLVVPNCP